MKGFPFDPARLLQGEEREWAVRSLRSYYREYAGGWFERLPNRDHLFTFDARDIVAVSLLGVDVPAWTSVWLLDGPGRDATASLLAAIPHGVPIWEADESVLSSDSAAQRLWDLFLRCPGVGPVIAGKLLATKRPELIPVWDQWIDAALGRVDNFWLTMRDVFADAELRADLAAIRDEAKLPCMPSLLRTLDVIVWMRRYGHKDSTDEELRLREFVSDPLR